MNGETIFHLAERFLLFLRRHIPSVVMLLLFPLALLLNRLSRLSPWATEFIYARRIYPVLSAVISFFTRFSPVPIIELLAFALALLAVAALIYGLVHIRRFSLKKLGVLAARLLCAASVVFFLFNFEWGFNYNRYPVGKDLNYKTGPVTKEVLSALLTSEIDSINALTPHIRYDAKNQSYYPGGFLKLRGQINSGYVRLAGEYSFFDRVPVKAKSLIFSRVMSQLNIDGIFIPFTYEPCISTVCPQYMWPFNMAHESAHFKGFAREDDANFISYLANLQNTDVYCRYSAHMAAYMYLSNALYDTDRTLWQQVACRLNAKAVSDINAYNAYVQATQSPVSKVSQQVNDNYLKSQGQSQGVVSYDMFVNLLADRYYTQAAGK